MVIMRFRVTTRCELVDPSIIVATVKVPMATANISPTTTAAVFPVVPAGRAVICPNQIGLA